MKRLRSFIRAFAALVLWLHAAFILPVSPPPIAWLAHAVHLQSTETTILLLLASLSLLRSYGWKNVAVDSLYIYFFPFIVVFQVASLLLSPLFRNNKRSQAEARTVVVANVPRSTSSATWHTSTKGLFDFLRLPFQGYTFLWCVLIVFSTNTAFLWIGLTVVFIHAGRAVVRSMKIALKADGWLGEVDKRLTKQAEEAIQKVKAAEGEADEKELRNAVTMLRSFYATVKLLESRPQVTKFFIGASLIVFACAYVYLGFLFSFLYYGLARVQSIPYGWPNALVTSLFIPAMVGSLPDNVWIKAVGGVHWLLVVTGGIGTLVSYMQRRLNNLYAAIDGLTARLSDAELEQKYTTLSQKFSPEPATPPSTPAGT